jgi:NAD(P)-dependent dehydrogenase (short-subunit alcohol dehydrogenase family)
MGYRIAAALAEAGHAVTLLDRDERVHELAGTLTGPDTRSHVVDLADRHEVRAFTDRYLEEVGPCLVLVNNAGVNLDGPDGGKLYLDDVSDDAWDTVLDVNLRAHITAAKLLLPDWLARGEGYFVATTSAAGLLTQIGSAPYAVSKHAALAFAEWLSVTYGARGVRVSTLAPMGVATPMLEAGDADGLSAAATGAVRAAGEVLRPDAVAAAVVEALGREEFLILPHPEVLTFFRRKADDYERWLAGMRRLQASLGDAPT